MRFQPGETLCVFLNNFLLTQKTKVLCEQKTFFAHWEENWFKRDNCNHQLQPEVLKWCWMILKEAHDNNKWKTATQQAKKHTTINWVEDQMQIHTVYHSLKKEEEKNQTHAKDNKHQSSNLAFKSINYHKLGRARLEKNKGIRHCK